MSVLIDLPPPGLTRAQALLIGRHRGSLLEVAARLAERNGRRPTEVMLLVASRQSRIGMATVLALQGAVKSKDVVVVPGRAADLDAWIERIATIGPVVDCTIGEGGVVTIVIDCDDQMALVRLR